MTANDPLFDAAILVVDDNLTNVALMTGILEDAGYRAISGLTDPREALQQLRVRSFDLVLLDIRMPHLSGHDVLRAIKEELGENSPPVIVLTAQTDRETCSLALELGALDFLHKPFDQGEVLKRIRNILQAHYRFLDRQKQAESLQRVVDHQTETLKQLAQQDAATGLPNRRALLARLQDMLAADRPVGVYFVVADDIEEIARLHGHPQAEHLLQALGELLIASPLAQGAAVACWGSNELVLAKPLSGPSADVVRPAERLVRLLSGTHAIEDLMLETSVRVGFTCGQGRQASPQTLVRQAAMALPAPYGDAWRAFDPQLERQIAEQRQMRQALKQAVPRKELHLRYQPKWTLGDRRIIGAEALLRWQSAELGAVRPDLFIPLAEQTGDIHAIGRWVLEEALAQLRAWNKEPGLPSDFALAVNVSSKQLMQAGFVDSVLSLLAASEIAPGRLKIEVTESGMIQDLREASQRLEALKAAGIAISIDDFGTGYSSLSYLKSLPLSELKIDRSFVKDIDANADDRQLASTIVAIAHCFGASVVAEGIETEAQLDLLTAMGCDVGQGYLVAPPLTADEFIARMISNA